MYVCNAQVHNVMYACFPQYRLHPVAQIARTEVLNFRKQEVAERIG